MVTHAQPAQAGPGRGVRPIYAIFEGGGARGITHIGALKALEREQLVVAGAAGSSAGAIIAALVAVGYTPDELFAEDGSSDILKQLGRTPIDLVGRRSWLRYGALRVALGPLLLLIGVAVSGAIWTPAPFLLLAGLAIERAVTTWRLRRPLLKLLGTMALIALLGGLWAVAALWLTAAQPLLTAAVLAVCGGALTYLTWPIFVRRGLFSTDEMRRTLNALLLAKLKKHYEELDSNDRLPDLVTFDDIDPKRVPQCARLKIIASDVRSGQLVVFDHATPGVVVADAVAASAAIPFVFEPPVVRGARLDRDPIFVDGGLVSNLPAWSFRAEKRALEREGPVPNIPILAFTLAAPPARPGRAGRPTRPGLTSFIADVIRTGIFGSQKIVQEFVADLFIIDLPSPLGTLGFNCTREQAGAAYRAGLDRAATQLAERRKIADATVQVLSGILDDVGASVFERRAKAGSPTMPRLRMCLIDPVDSRATAFRVTASAGMEEDSDDRLEIDSRNDVAPLAFRERVNLFRRLKDRTAAELVMTKYERALVSKDVESVVCIPVFHPTIGSIRVERVLSLDSTDSLKDDFDDAKFMELLTKRAITASRILIERPIRESR